MLPHRDELLAPPISVVVSILKAEQALQVSAVFNMFVYEPASHSAQDPGAFWNVPGMHTAKKKCLSIFFSYFYVYTCNMEWVKNGMQTGISHCHLEGRKPFVFFGLV